MICRFALMLLPLVLTGNALGTSWDNLYDVGKINIALGSMA